MRPLAAIAVAFRIHLSVAADETLQASGKFTGYDPRPVIDNDFVDEETAVIYHQFARNGSFRDAKSTVKISGNRGVGALAASITGTEVVGDAASRSLSKETGRWKIADELYQTGQ